MPSGESSSAAKRTTPTGGLRAAAQRIREMTLKDNTAAIAEAEAELDACRTGDDSDGLADVLAAYAHSLCYANRFEEALDRLEEAVRYATEARDEAGLAMLELTAVQPLARLGRLADAADKARRAHDRFAGAGMPLQAGRAAANLGIVLRMKGDASSAIRHFEVAAANLAGDAGAVAAVQSNRAEALLDLDRVAEARAAFLAARDAFRAAGMARGAAIVTGNLADLCSRSGDIDAAIEAFHEADAPFRAIDAPLDAARLEAEEGHALLLAGAPRRALPVLTRAAERLHEGGLRLEAARAELARGLCLAREGVLPEAERVLRSARERAAESGAAGVEAEVRLALAEVLTAMHRADDAIAHARASQAAFVDRPLKLLAANLALADALDASGDSDGALSIAASCAGMQDVPAAARSRACHAYGRLLMRTGDARRARIVLAEAVRHAERVRGAIRAEQFRIAYLDSSRAVYSDAAAAAVRDEADPGSIFDIVERMRTRSLLDRLAAVGGAEHEYSELNALYARIGLQGSSPDVLDRISRIEDAIAASSPGVLGEVAPLTDAIARVPDDVLVLSFFSAGDSIAALRLHRGRASILPHVCGRSELVAIRRTLRVDLARAVTTGVSAFGIRERLWRALAGAFEGAQDPGHVAISPCSDLLGLPITATVQWGRPDCEGVWLIPSVSAALAIPRPQAPRVHEACIIGVSDGAGPRMEQEAATIAGTYRVAPLLGAKATRAAASEAVARAPVVHIAAHAVHDGELPMASRIVLADGSLTAREIGAVLRRGAAVFLAGCDTGRWDENAGEDVLGFVRALLVSGASVCAVSLWALRDVAAAGLFPKLHEEWLRESAEGVRPLARALAKAQRVSEAEGHPWHELAPVTLIGGLR